MQQNLVNVKQPNHVKIVLIAGVSKSGVIGDAGSIPWNVPDDLKFFRAQTLGHTVLMGRKTFESLGRPLPKRNNWVLSRSSRPDGLDPSVDWFCTVDDVMKSIHALSESSTLFVIGGSEIYSLFLAFADEVLLTHIPIQAQGKVVFPGYSDGVWEWPGFKEVKTMSIGQEPTLGLPLLVSCYHRSMMIE